MKQPKKLCPPASQQLIPKTPSRKHDLSDTESDSDPLNISSSEPHKRIRHFYGDGSASDSTARLIGDAVGSRLAVVNGHPAQVAAGEGQPFPVDDHSLVAEILDFALQYVLHSLHEGPLVSSLGVGLRQAIKDHRADIEAKVASLRHQMQLEPNESDSSANIVCRIDDISGHCDRDAALFSAQTSLGRTDHSDESSQEDITSADEDREILSIATTPFATQSSTATTSSCPAILDGEPNTDAELWNPFPEISAEEWDYAIFTAPVPSTKRLSNAEQHRLSLEVREKRKGQTIKDIHDIISSRFKDKSGIVRCASRLLCDEVATSLREKYRIRAECCHGGMNQKERGSVCERWKTGEIQVVVSTVS